MREVTREELAAGRRRVLVAAVLWSVSGVVAKGLDLPPSAIAFYRGLFAGLALLPFVPAGGVKLRPGLGLLIVLFGAMTGLYLAAIKATTAANAIFLQCTSTFWTVPLSFLVLGERPDRRSLAGIGLAMVGVAAIVLYGYAGPEERPGIVLGLASGVCYAAVAVGLRAFRGLDPTWLSAANNLGGAAVLGAWTLATAGPIAVPTAGQGAVLVAFGVFQMAIPYALFARGLRSVPAPEAGLIGLLEPVLNPIWVVLFIGERPQVATIVGGLFLLGGVAVRYVPVSRVRV